MDASKYWKYQTAIAGIMGFLLGIGFQQDNSLLVVLTFIVGISSLLYLRRRVEKPIHDERSSLISTKASSATFSAFTLGSLAVATILFYLGNTSNPECLQWSFGLAYIICAIMVLRFVFWIYYTRRYGG